MHPILKCTPYSNSTCIQINVFPIKYPLVFKNIKYDTDKYSIKNRN